MAGNGTVSWERRPEGHQAGRGPRRRVLQGWSRNLLEGILVLIMIALLVAITAAVEPKFMDPANLINIERQWGRSMMVSLGMTFVIIGGFIDLSVAGTINLVAVVTISLIQPLGRVPALLLGLGLGISVRRASNARAHPQPPAPSRQAEALFLTFGMSTVYSAIALLYSHGSTMHFWDMSASKSMFETIGSGNLGPFSVSFVIFLVCLALLWVFQEKTVGGPVSSASPVATRPPPASPA